MHVQRQSTGEIVSLDESGRLGSGGEARIYAVAADPALVAKIWHRPTAERARKVEVMVANPPADPMAGHSHISIAWPLDPLLSRERSPRCVGFLMARVQGMRPIIDFYNPKSRRQKCPLFNFYYLLRTGRNLATAIRALHERGYVVGDLNESNILVSEKALVTLVDTDSFQVWDASGGTLYRCRVGKPEFTPPELQGQRFALVNREPVHDLFGLGIVLFHLLMEGTHPFAGAYRGRGEPPTIEQRIAAGHFPYDDPPPPLFGPKPAAPPFEVLHPALQEHFQRCFRDGHRDPRGRPDAATWQRALEEAESALVVCWFNNQHFYGNHLKSCPWCARAQLLGGRDPFPSLEAVRKGHHLRRPKPRAGAIQIPGESRAGLPMPPPVPKLDPWHRSHRAAAVRLRGARWAAFAGSAAGITALGLLLSLQYQQELAGFLLGCVALVGGVLGEVAAAGREGLGTSMSRGAKYAGIALVAATLLRGAW